MPHVVLQFTPNLEQRVDMTALCREIASTLIAQRTPEGKSVFPIGGTRVLAYPAHAFAVADSAAEYAFCYINIRIAPGRSDAEKKAAGDAVLACVKARFAQAMDALPTGLTLQIDESHGQVYDAKHSTLHPLFKK